MFSLSALPNRWTNVTAPVITVVPSAENTVQREHKEWVYAQRKSRDASLGDLVTRLDNGVFSLVRRIQTGVKDTGLSDANKVGAM